MNLILPCGSIHRTAIKSNGADAMDTHIHETCAVLNILKNNPYQRTKYL